MTSLRQAHPSSDFSFAAPLESSTADESSGWMPALRTVRRRIWLILAITLAICLAALPSIIAIPKVYYAETRVMLTAPALIAFSPDVTGREVKFDLDTEIERLISDAVLAEVMERHDILQRPEFNESLKPDSAFGRLSKQLRQSVLRLTQGGVQAADEPAEDMDKIWRNFREALYVHRHGLTSVVTIGFTSEDPALSAAVPASIVETYLRRTNDKWQAEIDEAAEFLRREIAFEMERVESTREAFAQFRERVGLLTASREEDAAARLLLIEERLETLTQERFAATAALRSIAEALVNTSVSAISEPERLALLRADLKTEQRKLADLLVVYGKNSVVVRTQEARLEKIEEDISTELENYERILTLRDAGLRAEARELNAEADRVRREMAATREATPQGTWMAEVLRAQEEQMSLLEYRLNSVLSRGQFSPVSLEILNPARRPTEPVGPRRSLFLAIIFVGGVLCALVIAILLEVRDRSLRSHEQIAHLPRITPLGLWSRLAATDVRRLENDLRTRTRSAAAEAVRDAVAVLEHGFGGKMPPALLVAPIRSGDDTVPVARLIALDLLARNHNVCLVECGEHPTAGLPPFTCAPKDAHRLSQITLDEEVLEDGGDVSDVLASLIEEARQQNVVAIFNGPPLLQPGSLRYLTAIRHTVLVLRWGRTPIKQIELLATLLPKVSQQQVSSVIVDAKPNRHRLYGFRDRVTLTSA